MEKKWKSNRGNHKLFCNVLKSLRKDKTINIFRIRSKREKLLTEDQETMSRLMEYFQDFLSVSKDTEEILLDTGQEASIEKGNKGIT